MPQQIAYEVHPREDASGVITLKGPAGDGWDGPTFHVLGGAFVAFWQREAPEKPKPAKKK